jgi:hypothetical protein
MIRGNAAFCQYLFEVSIACVMPTIPTNGPQDQVTLKMVLLEVCLHALLLKDQSRFD